MGMGKYEAAGAFLRRWRGGNAAEDVELGRADRGHHRRTTAARRGRAAVVVRDVSHS